MSLRLSAARAPALMKRGGVRKCDAHNDGVMAYLDRNNAKCRIARGAKNKPLSCPRPPARKMSAAEERKADIVLARRASARIAARPCLHHRVLSEARQWRAHVGDIGGRSSLIMGIVDEIEARLTAAAPAAHGGGVFMRRFLQMRNENQSAARRSRGNGVVGA